MIERHIQKIIEGSLKRFPVVGILGSRQVGKTTLSKKILKNISNKNVIYLDLELPSDLNKLQEPELYLTQSSNALVIIDEIQRLPSLFPVIRALVDQNRVNGRFLILGSASPELIRHSSESLAGRIIYHELSPFTLSEIGYSGIEKLWLRGGFPMSYLAGEEKESLEWRGAFIKTFLEMDIPQLGIQIPAIQLRRFWTMLAHFHGQLWNASQLAKSLGVSAPTVRNYLDILEGTFIVRQLLPYHTNIKKRLVKSPKMYIRDTGLLHSLLNIRTSEDLFGNPVAGSSWEGFVIEQILSIIPGSWTYFFYRTGAGAEIDLLLFNEKRKPIAIEIKYSLSPAVSKGFWSACEDIACKTGYIIYPGKEKYPIGKGVYALPLQNIATLVNN